MEVLEREVSVRVLTVCLSCDPECMERAHLGDVDVGLLDEEGVTSRTHLASRTVEPFQTGLQPFLALGTIFFQSIPSRGSIRNSPSRWTEFEMGRTVIHCAGERVIQALYLGEPLLQRFADRRVPPVPTAAFEYVGRIYRRQRRVI